jgi:cell division protein FtsW
MTAVNLHPQAVPRGARRPYEDVLDYRLLATALFLLVLGLVMVTSASLSIAESKLHSPFYFVYRHVFAMGLGLSAALLAFATPMSWWQRHGTALFFFGILLLVLVLVPGLGRTANGATRWINLGPFSLQSSEYMKLFAVAYIAGYLLRRGDEVSSRLIGFIKPLLLIGMASVLTMAQPDFGTTAVILATVLGMLFLGGVPVWQFAAMLGFVGVLLVGLVLQNPERMERVTVFLNPFDQAFGAGYQLSQALIAFGRGELFGVGLGNGIQKQFYLPEAHTDFLLAVIGEELGLAGTLLVITLFAYITWRAFAIGARAEQLGQRFASYLAHGLGLGLGLQAFINIGVNVGLLPTKGLTLPFMSYGSNSIIVACIALAMILRVDFENRRLAFERRQGGAPWGP